MLDRTQKNRENLVAIMLCLILLSACKKDDEMIQVNENCDFKTELSAPVGFEINEIMNIPFNGALNELQFTSENTGYVLGINNDGGYADVFKTNDGGLIWTDLGLTTRVSPINMFFLNEKVGFISHYGANGNLLKTTDGGLNWTALSYHELNGNMYHMQKDSDDHLYAILAGLASETLLIKSVDEGATWQVINNSSELGFSLVTFSFKIADDKIYISGEKGKIIVTDLGGIQTKVIETNLSNIWDVEIIDKDNIVTASSEKTIKTTDGGTNWTEIYNRSARILNFSNSDKGLMILNKSYCPTDVYQANDVIAYTENGGISWVESKEATNLKINYSGNQKRTGERYIILVHNSLYTLKN